MILLSSDTLTDITLESFKKLIYYVELSDNKDQLLSLLYPIIVRIILAE